MFKRALRAVLVGVFFGSSAFAAVVLWNLNDRAGQIRAAEVSDPLWLQSKLQFELLRLKNELHSFKSGQSSPVQVELRYNIAWSRLTTMQRGTVTEIISEFNIDTGVYLDLENQFDALEPALLRLLDHASNFGEKVEAAEEIIKSISEFDGPMNQLATHLAQAKSTYNSEFRLSLVSLSDKIAILFVLLFSVVAVITIILAADSAASQKTANRMRRLAKEARASSTAKDKFIVTVSHELRTPLTSIMGGIKLLKANDCVNLTASGNKILNLAERNANRLLALVNDILDADELQSADIKVDSLAFNLLDVTQDAVSDCQHYADQFGVTFSVDESSSKLFVDGDMKRTSQVLCNLLSNAAKYSDSGKNVKIRVFDLNDELGVEIRDQGIGISEEETANVFARFHQINPGTTGQNKSTGLGLFISKKLIELQNGTIGFTSKLGVGSTFWFTLPKSKSDELPSEQKDCLQAA